MFVQSAVLRFTEGIGAGLRHMIVGPASSGPDGMPRVGCVRLADASVGPRLEPAGNPKFAGTARVEGRRTPSRRKSRKCILSYGQKKISSLYENKPITRPALTT